MPIWILVLAGALVLGLVVAAVFYFTGGGGQDSDA
jgi:hypothetical protein